ncbi:GFA family protein [Mesobacterium sp. TK19101]|uniref:GFA family protein n=1 Tax=Mesobacterium hydrothermale TaxID=3111907 RepID=A0ABU6HJ37_9RHOB|nr:GFA family protein [Mesobacterium sp. TK19101]MEC3862469.1 GFA family protein [Mesobacterium sp. TK19101]
MLTGTCLCGAVTWTFDGTPPDATACNCTACRRYGTLWAYDWDGGVIAVHGPVKPWARANKEPSLDFLFCPTCGCLAACQGRRANDAGHRPIAVNLRLADDPGAVAEIPLLRFDGLHSFEDIDPMERHVKDLWF